MTLIVFEGLNACGKSTQCDLLKNLLIENGFSVNCYNFPHVMDTSCLPLQNILNTALRTNEIISSSAVHLLFAAQRALYNDVIRRDLFANKVVLVDRYALSGIAYGYSRGHSLQWCKQIEAGLLHPKPDITFLLDIDPLTALRRMLKRSESLQESAHNRVVDDLGKVKDAYDRLVPLLTNCCRIDAGQPIDTITKIIVDALNERNILRF